MYRKKEDIRVRKVNNAANGLGHVIFEDVILPEEAPKHGRIFSKVIVPPHCSIGYHKHTNEYEAYIILKGEALINDNGTEIILHEGDMHICKDGDSHGAINNTEEDLVLFALVFNTL